MAEQDLIEAARALLDLCRARNLTIAAAESCTGGLLAATLTEIPGSSEVFDRGFVTYSNDAKTAMLGVPVDLIATFGAVSREAAQAMAGGALAHAAADLAVAITGIAGPGGAMPGKPVGLVHFAATSRDGRRSHQERRFGNIGRVPVRRESVRQALAMLHELADEEAPSR
jgi:nicotinamide-nucleotide amidase